MSECLVCGENNFECISGLYYCTTCQSQSQNVVAMDIEEVTSAHYKFGKRKHKEKESTQTSKYGRLWTTTEGFQFIIKEQVNALIGLGADPKLKEIVFEIWVKYLKKTGIAFCDESFVKTPIIQKYQTRSRDAQDATSRNPYIKPIARHRMIKDSSKELYGSRRTSINQYRHLERMSLLKTIAFCYLGLLYTNNLTTISDLVRWINLGKIPYINCSNLFPENIKFFAEDTLTFNSSNLPRCRNIRKLCGLLANFLELDDLPCVPITDLANKYLCQLDLPGELHGILNNLTCKTPNIWVNPRRYQILPPYECIAIAYIVVLLKMLFGLDGTTERNLSNFAQIYSFYTTQEQKMFNWDEWVVHINKKVKNLKHYCGSLQQNDLLVVQDLSEFLTYCENMSRSNTRISVLKERLVCKDDVHKSIENIFNLMTDRLKESHPILDQDFPNPDLMSNQNHGLQFRKASVRFITHPRNFLEMNPFNITNSTILSAQIQSPTENSADDANGSFSSGEESSDFSTRKKKWGRIRQILVRKFHGIKKPEKIDLASKEKLLQLLCTSYKKYIKLPDETLGANENEASTKKVPFTYLWLLFICSSIIEENCSMLDCQVKNIESLYHIRKISKFRQCSLRHMNMYFKGPS